MVRVHIGCRVLIILSTVIPEFRQKYPGPIVTLNLLRMALGPGSRLLGRDDGDLVFETPHAEFVEESKPNPTVF